MKCYFKENHKVQNFKTINLTFFKKICQFKKITNKLVRGKITWRKMCKSVHRFKYGHHSLKAMEDATNCRPEPCRQ